MYSKEGEYVKFDNGKSGETIYEANGEVEQWLNDLELIMKLSLNSQLSNSREAARDTWETVQTEKSMTRDRWIELYCAQISLIITLIVWTDEMQNAINEFENGTETALKDMEATILKRIQQLIQRVRGELPKGLRKKLITIITVDVHGRDVVQKFKTKIPMIESEAFDWLKQLRYYYRPMENYELKE